MNWRCEVSFILYSALEKQGDQSGVAITFPEIDVILETSDKLSHKIRLEAFQQPTIQFALPSL